MTILKSKEKARLAAEMSSYQEYFDFNDELLLYFREGTQLMMPYNE